MRHRFDTLVVVISIAAVPFVTGCGLIGEPPTPTGPTTGPIVVPGPTVVPWSELPPLSEEAKRLVVEYNIQTDFTMGGVERGTVKRWRTESFPLAIWASYGTPDDLQAVTAAWASQGWSDGVYSFRIVSTMAEAVARLDARWPPDFTPPPEACAVGGPRAIQMNLVTLGTANFKPNCSTDVRKTMAHELCHILLPLNGHTTSGDICSSSPGRSSGWFVAPATKEALTWIAKVPAGTRPI